ncbi:MAG: restriction endonuclease subunit S [Cyanobacteria bacterium]|nr:restriction endonuclease subunit S [Cyanobacteriota bacterium]
MSNWETLPLGNVLTFQRGFDITKAEQSDGPYWVISSSGPKSTNEQFKVEGPGVIIGRKGSLGTVFYSGANYWPHDTTLWVKDFHGNNPKFAYYFLQTMGLERLDAGSSNPSLNRNHIHTIPVLWPSPPTQRRIAGILSAYDDLIENSQRRIKILEEMARRLYREWFVYIRFPGHEGRRLVQSPLGEIPEGWEVGRLDEVLVLQRGFDLPKSDRVDGSVPIYVATGVTGFYDTAKVGPPGVVTGRSGSIGEVLYVQEGFWPLNTALWVKDFPRSEPLYAYYLLSSLDLMPYNSGAAVPTLNRNDIHGIQVLIPSQDLQQHFQYVAGSLLSQVRAHSLQINNLHRARDLLLPRLLSGQIDVEALSEPVLSES